MLDLVVWYVWMQLFALAGWWIASAWLHGLPDRGYGVSKALGVLLGGYVYWLATTLGLARNDAGAALLALAVVGAAGLALRAKAASAKPAPAGIALSLKAMSVLRISLTRGQVATEIAFAGAFVLCALYRAYNPNIESAGGEKFMESMFLNAILRSDTFPPNDAWLSGFSISYYYFGYVQQAMLTKLSGIAPGIAFNLSGAMTFALTVCGAFGLGSGLWQAWLDDQPGAPATQSRRASPILAGIVTATLLAGMGNMGGLLETARCARVLPQSFWTWLDVRDIAKQPLECSGLEPTRFYWWWNWSRVVHDRTPYGTDQEAITEFPAFSFILGDNHPHVMNLPFVILAAALALHYWRRRDEREAPLLPALVDKDGSVDVGIAARALARFAWQAIQPIEEFILAAVVIGALSFMNTWDFPVFGTLAAGALGLRAWMLRKPLGATLVKFAALFIVGYALYYPWYATFASQARGLMPNLFNGTRLVQFLVQFAPFAVLMVSFLAVAAREFGATLGMTARRAAGLTLAALGAILVLALVVGLASPTLRSLLDELNRTGSALGVRQDTVLARLAARIYDPLTADVPILTPLFLLFSAGFAALLVLKRRALPAPSPAQSTTVFALVLFAAGALLAAAVEFVFLLDNFGTRMNSIFKFWYMAWVLWSLAGGFALMRLLHTRRPAHGVVAASVLALMLAGLLFPVYAAMARTGDFRSPPTLDGAAYLRQYHPDDAKAIDWLNANVQGDPGVIEAPGDKGGSYKYEGRVAAFTGLPEPLGWGGHESQWRGNYDAAGRREPEIELFFNSTDPAEARRIARQLQLEFVFVGEAERSRYAPEGLAKFEQMGRKVFQSGQTAVYRIR